MNNRILTITERERGLKIRPGQYTLQADAVGYESYRKKILIQEIKQINPIVNTLPVEVGGEQKWTSKHTDGDKLKDSKYRIFVITVAGNSFQTVAEPYNT